MIATLPLDDWQFYIVTLLAMVAIFLIVRPFLPSRKKTATRSQKKVKLTVRSTDRQDG